MTQTTATATTTHPPHPQYPYAKSWIDYLTAWIERLPLPAWVVYAFALVFFAVTNNVVFWIDGALPAGTFDFVKTSDAVFILFFLAFYHHLAYVAGQCFADYRQVLNLPEAELQVLEYRLTTLPRMLGLITFLLGLVMAVVSVQTDPAVYGLDTTHTILPLIYQQTAFIVTTVTLFTLVAQLIRQLRLVNELHRLASDIDIFQLAPFHAFAHFTARAATGLVLFILFNSILAAMEFDVAPLWTVMMLSIIAVTIFVVPLLGIRHRLEAEKERQLGETNAAIKLTIRRIHDEVNADTYRNVADLNTTMTALVTERKILEDISTWPWNAGTLRGFTSTLLVPLLLWLVTRLLERLI